MVPGAFFVMRRACWRVGAGCGRPGTRGAVMIRLGWDPRVVVRIGHVAGRVLGRGHELRREGVGQTNALESEQDKRLTSCCLRGFW